MFLEMFLRQLMNFCGVTKLDNLTVVILTIFDIINF